MTLCVSRFVQPLVVFLIVIASVSSRLHNPLEFNVQKTDNEVGDERQLVSDFLFVETDAASSDEQPRLQPPLFPPETPQQPLNILLLYADDWRHDTLGATEGSKVIQTPLLDLFAQQGMGTFVRSAMHCSSRDSSIPGTGNMTWDLLSTFMTIGMTHFLDCCKIMGIMLVM